MAGMEHERRWGRIGGHVVLDLVDSISWRFDPARQADRLPDVAALLAWANDRGVIDAGTAEQLAVWSDEHEHEDDAAAGLIAVHRLRDAVTQVLDAELGLTDGDQARDALALLAERWREALAFADVPPRLPLTWSISPSTVPGLAQLLALEIGDFLRQDHAGLRCCAGPGCGWLFLDTSRNHSRRWCDPADCGNRVRVARHAQRQQGRSA